MSEEKQEKEVATGAAQMFMKRTFEYQGATYTLVLHDIDDEIEYAHYIHQRAALGVLKIADIYRQAGVLQERFDGVDDRFAAHQYDFWGKAWAQCIDTSGGAIHWLWQILKKSHKGIEEGLVRKMYEAHYYTTDIVQADGSKAPIRKNRLYDMMADLLKRPNSEEVGTTTKAA